MRNNLRNSRKLWYATYLGQDYVRDENGDITGDLAVSWSEPVMFKASLSATRGTQGFTGTGERVDYFGADIDYSLIISTCNMSLPIDEYSLIWKHEPDVDANGQVDYSRADYRVTAVARGQRHMKYAIKELAKTTLPDPFERLTGASQGDSGSSDDIIIVP
jgi:hypothetical protein